MTDESDHGERPQEEPNNDDDNNIPNFTLMIVPGDLTEMGMNATHNKSIKKYPTVTKRLVKK